MLNLAAEHNVTAQKYASAGSCHNTLPAGVTLTTDPAIWDKAKAAWAAGKSPTSPLPTPRTATRMSARTVRHQVIGTLRTTGGDPVGSAPVTLQRRPVGTHRWANISGAKTNSHGVAQTRVNPRRTSDFRWIFRGDSRHAGARSNPVRVHSG